MCRSCKNRGITLLETCVALAIVGIVLAITFPVFQSSKKAAGKASSYAKVRQFHLAYSLYREDYGGDNGQYGEPSTMNLPLDHYTFNNLGLYGLTWAVRRPGGCPPANTLVGNMTYVYSNVAERTLWTEEVVLFRDNAFIAADATCNQNRDWHAMDYTRTKTVVGVLLSGQIVTRTQRGNTWSCFFFADNPKSLQ